MFDRRTLENPLLFSNFMKKYPHLDSALVDRTMEFGEAENFLGRRYPEQMRQEPDADDDDFFSVNNCGMHLVDLRCRMNVCEYCGEEFEYKRSTKRYCCPSHRVMMCRKRKLSK